MSQRPKIYHANILFLVVLCLQATNFLFWGMPQFVRMILNEALFVLLPALVYLKLARLPFRETVRLRRPGWTVAVASWLIGAGLYPLAAISTAVYQQLLGYHSFGAERLLPHTALEGVLAIIAYAVMAPLCEEVLARGIIQRAYEELGPRRAILLAGGLFIIFHLSLVQGLGIIPLALALGYVYRRSESLVASMLTHFGANALAALVVTSSVFWQGAQGVLLSTPALLSGLVLAAAGLWLLRRATHPAAPEPASAERAPLWRAWPLLLAGLLYAGVVSVEVVGARFPERHLPPVQVEAAPWSTPVEWQYEIRNIIDAPVGEAQCTLTPDEDAMALLCRSQHHAYDVDTGHGRFIGGEGEIVAEGRWRRADGMALGGKMEQTFQRRSRTAWTFDGRQFVVVEQEGDEPEKPFTLPLEAEKSPFILPARVWPWTLTALPFADDYTAAAYVFHPYTWRQATQDSGPQAQLVAIMVVGQEEIGTPAGTFTAWKVQVGDRETAWYTVDAPHILIQYCDGAETWVLRNL